MALNVIASSPKTTSNPATIIGITITAAFILNKLA
jgi:hypothetical protein